MSDPLRFFVPAGSMHGDQIEIAGDPFHHLRNVLRVKPGVLLLLLDGLGQCCQVRLERLHADRAATRVIRRWREKDGSLPITLLQALPKGDKFDLILQKGTELGISSFQPLETSHAVPNLAPERRAKRQLRWQRIVAEAARQSRRCFLPEVKPLQPLAKVLDAASDNLKLVLWEAGCVALRDALPQTPPTGVSLLVGPEGGFSTAEIDTIRDAGFQAVHLGPRILRTETAGLAATPVLQYLYGDWQCAPAVSEPGRYGEISCPKCGGHSFEGGHPQGVRSRPCRS
jgi:16S rRNA (uracil1498-N3)-methyltransferase